MRCHQCGIPLRFALRPICNSCKGPAVTDINEARRLMAAAQAWMRSEGMAFRHADIPLTLTSALDSGPHSRGNAETLGRTRVRVLEVAGLFRRTSVEGIDMCPGRPRLEFESTLVHELTHAWIADQGIRGLGRVEEEGLCQLNEYRWAARLKSPEARQLVANIERRDDAVYGAGFRIMRRRMLNAGGFQALLRQISG